MSYIRNAFNRLGNISQPDNFQAIIGIPLKLEIFRYQAFEQFYGCTWL